MAPAVLRGYKAHQITVKTEEGRGSVWSVLGSGCCQNGAVDGSWFSASSQPLVFLDFSLGLPLSRGAQMCWGNSRFAGREPRPKGLLSAAIEACYRHPVVLLLPRRVGSRQSRLVSPYIRKSAPVSRAAARSSVAGARFAGRRSDLEEIEAWSDWRLEAEVAARRRRLRLAVRLLDGKWRCSAEEDGWKN
ncbi:UPF0502 protein HCH_06091 [Striga asiatica]|uniref:UPF0502 protein HCH_06091 n=1 Tax=Striga asiatica TaxID=4170 RepID=A0A5A7RHA0_STRAF|nr:UPF0502 protein HCH_06091 [Striga asiatica]